MVENLEEKLEYEQIDRLEYEDKFKRYISSLEQKKIKSNNAFNVAVKQYNQYLTDYGSYVVRCFKSERGEIMYTKDPKKKIGFIQ